MKMSSGALAVRKANGNVLLTLYRPRSRMSFVLTQPETRALARCLQKVLTRNIPIQGCEITELKIRRGKRSMS